MGNKKGDLVEAAFFFANSAASSASTFFVAFSTSSLAFETSLVCSTSSPVIFSSYLTSPALGVTSVFSLTAVATLPPPRSVG